MRIILLRNKIFSSLRYQKSRKIKIYNNKKYSITKPNYLISFGKKQKCGFIKGDCIFVAIKSIKDICHKTKEKDSGYDLGYVYNLEVENDNSYQVNGVAVHNCHQYISQHGIRLPDTQDSDLVKAKLSYSIMTPEAMAIEKQNLQDCLPYLYLMKNRPLKFHLLATLQQTTIALLKKVLKLLKKKNNRV